MSSLVDEAAVLDALSRHEWWMGFCRGGAQRDSFVLAWPLGDGLWDLALLPDAPFDGASGGDVYAISRDDVAAVKELVRADIELAPSRGVAHRAVLDVFPKTRAALRVQQENGGGSAGPGRLVRTRPHLSASGPWGRWGLP